MIHPALSNLIEPISALEPHSDNPRRGDAARVAGSLERFGQLRPIVADELGVVLAGHHLLEAAILLGWEQVAVVRVALDVDEARAYMVADNRLADLGVNDDAALLVLLGQLAEDGALEGTGYVIDDYEDLVAALGHVAVSDPQAFEGGHRADDADPASRERVPVAPMREITLVFPDDDTYQQFRLDAAELAARYGITGTTNVVLRAVEAAYTGLAS